MKPFIRKQRNWLIYWVVTLLCFLGYGRPGTMIIGSNIYFLIPDLLLVLVALAAPAVGAVVWVIKKRPTVLFHSLVNLVLVPVFFVLAMVFPPDALVNLVRGKPVITAHYRGTMNGATLILRENKRFDIFWFGWLGYSGYFTGSYTREEQKLHFSFSRELPRNFTGDAELVRGPGDDVSLRVYYPGEQDTGTARLDYLDFNVKENSPGE